MDALFIDYVNSRWHFDHGQGADFLCDLTRLNSLLGYWGLPKMAELTEAQSQEFIALRVLLTEAVTALASGAAPTAETLAQLNGYLAGATVNYVLEPNANGCRAVLRPASEPDSLMPAAVRSFAQFTIDHEPARLRVCGNPECRGVFYDESRNATRRWCAPICGSLIRVRRHRSSQR